MVTRFIGDYRVLLVPGLNNSGPDHWQSRWQQMYPSFERVEQVNWEVPDLFAWSDRLEQELKRSTCPTLIIAHSFGCLATVHCASRSAGNLAGALLVAPADPCKFGVEGILQQEHLACRSIFVGSTNDPWMEWHQAEVWAHTWQCEFVSAGQAGHINADSELGHWPFGLLQLQRLVLDVESLNSSEKNGEPERTCSRK